MLLGWVSLCALHVQSVLFICVEDVPGDFANFYLEAVKRTVELKYGDNLERPSLKTDVR